MGQAAHYQVINRLYLSFLSQTVLADRMPDTPTATYNAWLHEDGALFAAVADMSSFRYLTVARLWPAFEALQLQPADVVVLDANILAAEVAPSAGPATLADLAARIRATGAFGMLGLVLH